MVRVRLEGLPDEVQRIADAMQAAGCVLERSREYPNRGERGGKRKKTGRVKTLPVSSAVSTSLPASPVDPASVVNIDNKDDENIVLDIGDYPIVTDPIAPET